MDARDKLRRAIADLLDAEKRRQDCCNAVRTAEGDEARARKELDESRAMVVRVLRASGTNVASDGVTWKRVCYSVDPSGKLVTTPDGRLRLDKTEKD